MIKKFAIFCMTALMLSSCMSMQNGGTSAPAASSDSNSQSMLGSLLSGLIGGATKVTEKTLVGTWNYSSPDCRFTSEDALSQAGGALAASTVENKLAEVYGKVGIAPNTCSFTFNADKSCSITLGGRTISGTYTLDSENRSLHITSNTGLINLTSSVYYDYSTLTVLFDAQKLLNLIKVVATFTGQGNSTIGTLSTLLNQYNGMMIGMNLKK